MFELTGTKITKKLSKILCGFDGIISDLEKLNVQMNKQRVKNSEKAQDLRDKADELIQEAETIITENKYMWEDSDKVNRIITNIKKLIEA